MRIHEDFIRCPKCNHPYFRRVEYALLDKLFYENTPPIIKEHTTYAEHLCMDCGHILHKEVLEQN